MFKKICGMMVVISGCMLDVGPMPGSAPECIDADHRNPSVASCIWTGYPDGGDAQPSNTDQCCGMLQGANIYCLKNQHCVFIDSSPAGCCPDGMFGRVIGNHVDCYPTECPNSQDPPCDERECQ